MEAAPSPSSKSSTQKTSPPPSTSGTCPFHNWFYIGVAILGITYAVYVGDKDGFKDKATSLHLGPVYTIFQLIDKYSPFNEILESDEDILERLKKQHQQQSVKDPVMAERVFTVSELAKYDGKPGSPGLYLALLGVVYDVSKGHQYYGQGGGYSFFVGRDASRAFVTGQFDEAGLVPEVGGLSAEDYLGLEEWQEFYTKDYMRVGVVEGVFYDGQGKTTQHWADLQKWTAAAREKKDNEDVERKMFPPCNVEWSQADGSRYWCTQRSGGVVRSWVGVPRQLYYPGRDKRCACVRTKGPPSIDPSDTRNDRGDLDNPHLKEYPGCAVDNTECKHKDS